MHNIQNYSANFEHTAQKFAPKEAQLQAGVETQNSTYSGIIITERNHCPKRGHGGIRNVLPPEKGEDMKSFRKRIEEGRCLGIGRDYVPFILANEARSIGTASEIWDPVEQRQAHTMSKTETLFWYSLRWDEQVAYIREQFMLDMERINNLRVLNGLRKTASVYTTDFLVDYHDGSRKAFSVKMSRNEFNPSRKSRIADQEEYWKLINRQYIEQQYWEEQGVPFRIVTMEDLDRARCDNIAFLMSWYEPERCTNTDQRLVCLLAHRIIETDLSKPVRLQEVREHMNADTDTMFYEAFGKEALWQT